MDHFETLLAGIENRTARVAVVGLGYVGLPLAVAFARAGFVVIGVDASDERVAVLQRGESHVPDVPAAVVAELLASGRLRVTARPEDAAEADVVSICVPTPLGKSRDPDISYVVAATDRYAALSRPGQLVVLESTTYPGTTREVLLPRLEERGRSVGKDLFLAFSPERVDPGNPRFGIHNTPKVVGGITERCTRLAAALYATVVSEVVPVSSPESAELVKLLENTFRAVNIGLANEIALVCDKLKLDVWEVIAAAGTKPFGFMPFYPGPGLGGHCIPIDPHYLAWKLRTLDYRVRFIELADDVNRSMPEHVVHKVVEALNHVGKPLKGSRLLLLGLAYKRDVGDIRESPSLDIARMLVAGGAELTWHDALVGRADLERLPFERTEDLGTRVLESLDAAIIATDHSHVDYGRIVRSVPLVVDARNATRGLDAPAGRIWRI